MEKIDRQPQEEKKKVTKRSQIPQVKLYKVQAGDTLSKIAKKFYGDESLHEKIYKVNKELIGSDPNLIKVGQELKIPSK